MNRKKWSNEEKVTIILEMVKGEESIASICVRHGVSATQAYRWQEQFLAGGRAALADKRRRGSLDPLADENRQLKAAEREQHQLLQWALKGFPADQVESENRRLNKTKDTLKAQKTDLEEQLKVSQDATINVPNLERFIKVIQDKLPNLDFEGKRLALDMLGITVWLDGENVEATGTIDPELQLCFAHTSSE